MEEQKYLTIAEFAEAKNISKQRAYQLAEGKLKPYVFKIKGKKMVSIEALEEKTPEKPPLSNNPSKNQASENQVEKLENPLKFESVLIEYLKEQLDKKDSQLEARDRQIEALQQQLQALQQADIEKDKEILKQSENLQQLLSQAQTLHLQNQNLLAASSQPPQTTEIVVKPTFWSRLFKKKGN